MKDAHIHIRISATEKSKFVDTAKEQGMDLSTFFLTAAREKVLKLEIAPGAAPGEMTNLIKKMDQLEKLVLQSNNDILEAIQEVSPEEREDLLLAAATDKVFWMLQQEKFQEDTRDKIKLLLQQSDPKLIEYLEETPKRLFTALELALEKLEQEGILQIGRKTIHWKN